MASIRPPAVAGTFYPAEPRRLAELVDRLLAAAGPADRSPPRALIAPHAGYAYSGAVAGSAYACLKGAQELPRRIIILGTAHRTQRPGLHAPSSTGFATPLGLVPVDRAALDALLRESLVQVDDAAHERDHAIEVQLPFLQRVAPECAIVPLLVSAVAPKDLAAVLGKLAAGPETLVVVSSDLSHYLSQWQAERLDLQTAEQIVSLDAEGLNSRSACGVHALRGLIVWAARTGLHATCLDLRTSADAGGDPDRVVGYGAFRFDPASGPLSPP